MAIVRLQLENGDLLLLEEGTTNHLLLEESGEPEGGGEVPPVTGLGGTFTGAGPVLGDTWSL